MFSLPTTAVVVNLAAQADVRYSITNPDAYIHSNIIGFYNILEACRHHEVEHLVYASSSSVYGSNKKVPYSTDDKVDNPVSLYAATKKYLIDIELDQILEFEKGLFEYVDTRYPEIPDEIRTKGEMSKEIEEKLVKAIEEFKADFVK